MFEIPVIIELGFWSKEESLNSFTSFRTDACPSHAEISSEEIFNK